MPFLEWSGGKYEWKKKYWKFPVWAMDAIEADYDAARGVSHPLNYFRREMDRWVNGLGREAFSYIGPYNIHTMTL